MDDEKNKANPWQQSRLRKTDVNYIGRAVRNHYEFASTGCKCEFCDSTVSESELRIRTYERGVERETLHAEPE